MGNLAGSVRFRQMKKEKIVFLMQPKVIPNLNILFRLLQVKLTINSHKLIVSHPHIQRETKYLYQLNFYEQYVDDWRNFCSSAQSVYKITLHLFNF